MTEPTPGEILLSDPLREVTRKERRSLLGASAIAITIAKTGLVPSKIPVLGIEFSEANQSALLWVLAGVVLYFLLAFLIYASSDFLAWLRDLRSSIETVQTDAAMRRAREQTTWVASSRSTTHFDDFHESIVAEVRAQRPGWARLLDFITRPMSIIRATFEFLLPIVVGVYAIIILLLSTPGVSK